MREPLFRLEAIRKRFSNGYEALRGVNLEIWTGEFLVIAGANGSGKTVLMRCLIGLAAPSSGRIFHRGQLTTPGVVNSDVGLVFQDADAQLIGETVEEDISFGPNNLRLNRDEVRHRTEAAMEMMDLTTKRDFPPRRLSGGEKRRLAIAGILAMGCDTIIMDEPFANLDWPGIVLVLRALRDLKEAGKTLIVLTHELEKIVAHADRLALLAEGRICEDGPPELVLDKLIPKYAVRDPRRHYDTVKDCTWIR